MVSQCVSSRKKNVSDIPVEVFYLRGMLEDNVYNNNPRTEDEIRHARCASRAKDFIRDVSNLAPVLYSFHSAHAICMLCNCL
jgi:hypothetical protein